MILHVLFYLLTRNTSNVKHHAHNQYLLVYFTVMQLHSDVLHLYDTSTCISLIKNAKQTERATSYLCNIIECCVHSFILFIWLVFKISSLLLQSYLQDVYFSFQWQVG